MWILLFFRDVLMLGCFSDHFGSGGPDGVRGFFGQHQAGFQSEGTGPLHFDGADRTYTRRELDVCDEVVTEYFVAIVVRQGSTA